MKSTSPDNKTTSSFSRHYFLLARVYLGVGLRGQGRGDEWLSAMVGIDSMRVREEKRMVGAFLPKIYRCNMWKKTCYNKYYCKKKKMIGVIYIIAPQKKIIGVIYIYIYIYINVPVGFFFFFFCNSNLNLWHQFKIVARITYYI